MRFSIIIPMYNAENTLDKCLSSIVSQSFRDYQVLIVDDSSGDGSLAVAEQYAARDARFTVFSIGHGGPGAARNAGLDRAEGDYILHMDADDCWIRDDLLQELENRILTQPADVYMYQTIKVTEALCQTALRKAGPGAGAERGLSGFGQRRTGPCFRLQQMRPPSAASGKRHPVPGGCSG